MLLTSGQVSVSISSFIVFIFTTALFLSGYILQRQAVCDLRAAIKPQLAQPTPIMYLPPQFRDEALGLVPGPVDIDNGRNMNKEDGEVPVGGLESSSDGFADEMGDNYSQVGATRRKKAAAKDRRPAQEEVDPNQKLMMVVEDIVPTDAGSGETAPSESEPRKAKSSPEEKPLSRAERRKKIKEEILAVGEGEGFKGYRRRIW